MKDNIEKLELDENIEVLNINDTPVKEETDTFSVIKNYGEDLTKREYVTNPAIGREKKFTVTFVCFTPHVCFSKAGAKVETFFYSCKCLRKNICYKT